MRIARRKTDILGAVGVTVLAVAALVGADKGAQLIGGCCRTTPQDIRAIAARCKA